MLKQVQVLVVDDEEVILLGVKKILKPDAQFEYVVDTALSAEEGLKKCETTTYDLIISDIVMPRMDGVKFLKALAERKVTSKVIMFTGYATINTALQSLRMGACDFIAKPFTREELRKSILKALEEKAETEGDQAAERSQGGESGPD